MNKYGFNKLSNNEEFLKEQTELIIKYANLKVKPIKMSKDYGFGRHELKQVIDEIALKRTIYKELLLVINYRSGSDEQWETGNASACRMSILWDKMPKKYKVEKEV